MFNVGYGTYQLDTKTEVPDLANDQKHVAYVRRSKGGRKWELWVDDYIKSTWERNLPSGTDTKLDNPKYIYLGRNGKFCFFLNLSLDHSFDCWVLVLYP